MQAANDITFGRFRLDIINECLWQGTRAIALRPKAFAVLRLLLDHPGQLVNKNQLIETVWPGTFVSDAVLKDSVRQLREALEDDASSPTYIETAHRRGYRFIGKVSGTTSEQHRATGARSPLSESELKVGSEIPLSAAVELMGREEELAKLRGWLDLAIAGDRQLVFVTGEPGIGKTTLVQAFLERNFDRAPIRVMRGQCLEHFGANEAYLPILDGFSRLCRSSGGPQIVNHLRQHAPAWLAQMPSLLGPLERQELQSQVAGTTRERMLREMADAIETLVSETPLILVLEDLHWSDYSTLDLITFLTRRRDTARLMIVGTYRPVDVILADHPLKGIKRELQAHAMCHELPLEYLSEEMVADYLEKRFPIHRLPNQVRRTIYRRTEGNPLFMVNLVENWIEQRVIVEQAGIWELSSDVSMLEQGIPASLRELIEKQIERLSVDERRVLEAASVAGMECSSKAVAAGLDMPIEWVEKHAEELARRHQFLSPSWLVQLPDGTVTPRHKFIHVLYLEVPYSLIPPMRRAQIHSRIAECGAAIYSDRVNEIAAELAMHFEQSRDWPRALAYLCQAAGIATQRSAHHEATSLARRGLEVLKHLPESPDRTQREITLRMTLGVSLMAIKGFAAKEVEEVYAAARDLFGMKGPSRERFQMLWSLSLYYQFRGQMELSFEIINQMLELAKGLDDGAMIMDAHQALGAVLVMLGRCAEALPHLDEAIALYEAHHNDEYGIFIGLDCKVMCECFKGLAFLSLGYLERSHERMEEGLAIARELGHPQTLVVALHAAAQFHQVKGGASQTHKYAKEAMVLADEYGLELWHAFGVIELGWAKTKLGRIQEGTEQMNRGMASYESTGAKLRVPYFLALMADALAEQGRLEEALRPIERAIKMAQESGEGYTLAELHRFNGELLVRIWIQEQSGKVPRRFSRQASESSPILRQAHSCFAEALAVAKQQKARLWELRACISMCEIHLPSSREKLAESYSWFTEGIDTADLKRAKTLLDAVP